MTRSVRIVVGGAIAGAAVVVACGESGVVVAEYVDAGVDANVVDVDSGVISCTADGGECGPGAFCDLSGCGSGVGQCAPRQAASTCMPGFFPVCGCDGITYFNACLRQSAGVSAISTTADICTGTAAKTCDLTDPTTCPEGTTCKPQHFFPSADPVNPKAAFSLLNSIVPLISRGAFTGCGILRPLGPAPGQCWRLPPGDCMKGYGRVVALCKYTGTESSTGDCDRPDICDALADPNGFYATGTCALGSNN